MKPFAVLAILAVVFSLSGCGGVPPPPVTPPGVVLPPEVELSPDEAAAQHQQPA